MTPRAPSTRQASTSSPGSSTLTCTWASSPATSDHECESETRAALAGGVTTIGVFMGGGESYLPALPGLIETVDAKSSTDLFFHLSMFTPDQLDEIPAVHRRVRRHLLQVLHVRGHRRVPERGGRLHQAGTGEAGRAGWPSHRLRALREPGHVQRRLRQGGRGDSRRRVARMGRGRHGGVGGGRGDPGLPLGDRHRGPLLPGAPVVGQGCRRGQGEPVGHGVR